MALALTPQPEQKKLHDLTPEALYVLAKSGPSWWASLDDKVVALYGHVPLWAGRTMLWSYLGADAGGSMVALTKEVRRVVAANAVEFPRAEAYVERHHEAGHRWMKLLGFTRESGIMKKFAHGHDYVLYAKVS
jgi:hypothetical protein